MKRIIRIYKVVNSDRKENYYLNKKDALSQSDNGCEIYTMEVPIEIIGKVLNGDEAIESIKEYNNQQNKPKFYGAWEKIEK
jgi:hypothetical protein